MLRLASGLSSLTLNITPKHNRAACDVREGWRGSYALGPGAALDSLARSKLSGRESNTCQIGWTGNRVTRSRKTPECYLDLPFLNNASVSSSRPA